MTYLTDRDITLALIPHTKVYDGRVVVMPEAIEELENNPMLSPDHKAILPEIIDVYKKNYSGFINPVNN